MIFLLHVEPINFYLLTMFDELCDAISRASGVELNYTKKR